MGKREGEARDPGMLTIEEVGRVVTWLQERSGVADGHVCPVCGKNDWTVFPWRFWVTSRKPDPPNVIAPYPGTLAALPLVFIECRNCAHTQSFSATTIGV